MEQNSSTPYKSNYTIGIIFTVLTLLYVISSVLVVMIPAIACVGGIAGLISGILFLVWLYGSMKNLPAYNNQGMKYSPGLAVLSWFIPLANLVLPFLAIMELWKASDPDASTVSWKQSKVGIVVYLWWLSFFVFFITSTISMGSSATALVQSELSVGETNLPSMLMGASIPTMITLAINSILQISVVVLVNDRQDEKAENLGLLN